MAGAEAASERITLGVIGIGPRMTYDLRGVLPKPDVQCVAIADVQASRRDAGKKMVDGHYGNQDCVVYRDFRELLARPDIDAVMIGTGDRWHAPASILAAKAGKDVYSEKPCGLTIGLCQALDDTIRQTKRVFQAGTQRRSVANFQAAIRLAQSGKLGKIHTMFASVYTPSIETAWLPGEPTPPRDVVDWDLWLGPAPWRPYNQQYVAGGWRGQWDFDSGARLLDWGAHTVDLCQWANRADDTMPVEYEPTGKTITCPLCQRREADAGLPEDPLRRASRLDPGPGHLPGAVHRRRGLGRDGRQRRHRGAAGVAESGTPDVTGKRESGLDVATHARNFLDCVKSRGPTAANSQVMRHSHIACHAAALAWMLNRKLKFDPVKEEFVGDDEANGLRGRPARTPWVF